MILDHAKNLVSFHSMYLDLGKLSEVYVTVSIQRNDFFKAYFENCESINYMVVEKNAYFLAVKINEQKKLQLQILRVDETKPVVEEKQFTISKKSGVFRKKEEKAIILSSYDLEILLDYESRLLVSHETSNQSMAYSIYFKPFYTIRYAKNSYILLSFMYLKTKKLFIFSIKSKQFLEVNQYPYVADILEDDQNFVFQRAELVIQENSDNHQLKMVFEITKRIKNSVYSLPLIAEKSFYFNIYNLIL